MPCWLLPLWHRPIAPLVFETPLQVWYFGG